MDWNLLSFDEIPYPRMETARMVPPDNFDEMIAITSKLSKGIPFLRVDMYNVNGKILFGELTFYPASGFGSFSPKEWNSIIGRLCILSNNQHINPFIKGGGKSSQK